MSQLDRASQGDLSPNSTTPSPDERDCLVYETNGETGLSEVEVQERQARGDQNLPYTARSKSLGRIVMDNVFTLFNFLNVILALCVLVVAWREPRMLVNLTFMGIVVSNTVIGIVQEWRAKRTVDRLRVLADPTAVALRGGEPVSIPLDQIVRDDILFLRSGNQIPVDCICRTVEGFEVDESLLTGESDSVRKLPGELVLSGSFVVAGKARVQVLRISGETYVAGIAREVKRIRRIRSQILDSIRRIVKVLSILMIPVGALLFLSKFWLHMSRGGALSRTVISTVAALVGMIPEGLFLMTTLAFAVGILHLARRRTLVQTLPSIETLARVDVLCLDKTGTITTGEMEFLGWIPLATDTVTEAGMEDAGHRISDCAALTAPEAKQNASLLTVQDWSRDCQQQPEGVYAQLALSILKQTEQNATQQALAAAWISLKEGGRLEEAISDLEFDSGPLLQLTHQIPFQSQTKWAAAEFQTTAGFAWIALGAPEFLLSADSPAWAQVRPAWEHWVNQGTRVLLALGGQGRWDETGLNTCPDGSSSQQVKPIALLVLGDQIRSDARETLAYFSEQGVQLRVLSGDNPQTVSSVAKRVGISGAERAIDLSQVPEDSDWKRLVQEYTIFGRVTPQRKRKLLHALQELGHTVAMTGDGVNDVPALKDSDCAVSMASGSDAARFASDLVLLDNNLKGMVDAVYEGRRVINNIERVSILFLVKTIYSCLLAIVYIFLPFSFPIYPIQITLISALTIGLPGFVLALKPNRERVTGAFLQKVLYRCVPGGLACASMVILLNLVLTLFHRSVEEVSALSALSLITGGFLILWQICHPWDRIKTVLYASCLVLFVFAILFFPRLFFVRALFSWQVLPFILLLFVYPLILTGLSRLGSHHLAKRVQRILNRWVRHMDADSGSVPSSDIETKPIEGDGSQMGEQVGGSAKR